MRLSCLFLTTVFVCFISLAEAVAAPTQSYIEAQSLPPQLIPPPPAEGSAEWRKQVDGVLKAQKNLSSADIAAIKDEQHMRVDLLTSVIGAGFTRDRLPKTFALLDSVIAATGQVSEADKQFWHTRRPYLTDTHVKLYIDRIDSSPAYPSGHTSESRVLAEVLGMIDPDKLADLRARADVIALHRIEAGAHYPGDIEGGRLVAMLVVGALMENEDFQDDLADARKEFAANR